MRTPRSRRRRPRIGKANALTQAFDVRLVVGSVLFFAKEACRGGHDIEAGMAPIDRSNKSVIMEIERYRELDEVFAQCGIRGGFSGHVHSCACDPLLYVET